MRSARLRRTVVLAVLGSLAVVGLAACGPAPRAVAQTESQSKGPTTSRVVKVGPGKRFTVPSAAAKEARDGDVIEIDAGRYVGDVAVWLAHNLTIRGVGGLAVIDAGGNDAQDKGTWVISGNSTTVENIEFANQRNSVGGQIGAGIRQQGIGLTVRHCRFTNNENGILTNNNQPTSVIVIEYTEFDKNGSGEGNTHNMYIGTIGRFTLRYSYSHHAQVGHNVKTRARENFILYNRIMDEVNGTASYDIDVPNGGVAYIIGNLIQRGAQAENTTLVSYGAEGLRYPTNELYVVNNTFVNDRPEGSIFLALRSPAARAQLINNIFAGKGTVLQGNAEQKNNLVTNQPGLVDRAKYDYRLAKGSKAIGAGIDPGSANGVSLMPEFQYVHPMDRAPRANDKAVDVGAYAYPGPGQ